MQSLQTIRILVLLNLFIAVTPLTARHGSNIFLGGFMGAGMGAILGGHDGVVPGLVTGLTVGTAAEMMDDAHDHHHCHEIIYTHEVRPSREWLEEQVDKLDHKLNKAYKQIQLLEEEIEKKEFENHRLQKRIKQLEQAGHHNQDRTEIIFSAKAVSV